jgi:hypothetical protein
MRRLSLALSTVAAALLFAGCNGGNTTTPDAAAAPGTGAPQTGRLVDSGIANPKSLRLLRIPALPPPRRHKITTAMRERARAAGWQQLSSYPGFANGPSTELLMTDGTIMVSDYCTSSWFKLTPDENGNYITGTWTQAASMPSDYGPLYFASAVLADGKLIVNGGEYNFCAGAETALGAIYDPVANSWTAVSGPSGWSRIGDGQSAVLDNGTYMLGNCCTSVQALYNEGSSTWTQIGTGKNDENSEEGWALLRNGDLLVADVQLAPDAEIYSPKANAWSKITPTPVNLVTGFEIGPETLRPDNTVYIAGATGYSAIYHAKNGTWTQGPTFPVVDNQQLDVADGPSAMLTNGFVMIPASPGLYNAPTYYYIFNGKKLVSIAAPPQAVNDSTYNTRLLLLPTGQIMEADGSNDIEVYTPKGAGSGHAPTIKSVPTTLSPGSTYEISGKGFNGESQANMYGDDVQEATNFPLVRVTNTATGHVFYCRTHNHSFMGVGSSRQVSTMFDVPSTIETGASSLVVVADGVASAPVSVTIQ